MRESIGEITEQTMSGRESRRMRRDARKRGERRLAAAISVLLLSGAGGVVWASEASKDQSCEGAQNVPVRSGDTLDGLKHEHVEVPGGSRVDLDKVDADVFRSGAEVNTSLLQPGDTVVLPVSCQ